MAVLVDLPTYNKRDTKAGKQNYMKSLQAFCDYLEDDLLKREQIENTQVYK